MNRNEKRVLDALTNDKRAFLKSNGIGGYSLHEFRYKVIGWEKYPIKVLKSGVSDRTFRWLKENGYIKLVTNPYWRYVAS
jgi:hypothetical protein